jgi:predicted small lipoprotein YifL
MSLGLTIGTICTLLLALAACERKAGSHLPPSGNDFAGNADGHGTARLLGIDRQRHVTVDGAPPLPAGASRQQESMNPEADPGSSDAPTSPNPGESS